MNMDMGSSAMATMTAVATMTATSTMSMATTTDFTPGHIDSKGDYVPTSAERTAYQAKRVPWAHQVVYGYYALAFLLGILALHTFANAFWKLRIRHGVRFPLYSRVVALLRLSTYPRLPYSRLLSMVWTLGPLGPNLILIAGLLFVSCLTWINKYYYYAPFYGSAPLYLRSEWIAMATLPCVYLLGSKRNVISILTGVSHEKLQLLHQGAAFNLVYMSLVHTIAAIIRAYHDYGFPLELQYNSIYVSGFVALAPLLVLFVLSLPPIRTYAYESFYYIHIIMALFFLGALFWHGYDLLDSNAYCIATIVLFLSAAFWRMAIVAFNNPTLHLAQVEVVSSNALKIIIPTFTMQWRAGQHVFIRFIGVRPLESHPFTICNASSSSLPQEMVFIVRPQNGFTLSLFNAAMNGKNEHYRVLIDGPYGEGAEDLAAFDRVLLCVGGSGISFALGALEHLSRCERKPRAVKLVWAVRAAEDVAWVREELQALESVAEIVIHVTGTEAESAEMKTVHPGTRSGRPHLPTIVKDTINETEGGLAVGVCGPAAMLSDVSNAVSRGQLDILQGRLPDVDEIFMVSESYGW